MKTEGTGRLVRGIGPVAAISLVAGNIVGSGVYVIPASLATIAGPVSIFAWIICAAAFLSLAVVFADLGGAFPVTGGPQAFVGRAFGKHAELQTAFLYWFSCVSCNAAMAISAVGYLAVFFPALNAQWPAFSVAQALLWGFTIINIIGVKLGARMQAAAMILKVLPLLFLSVPLLARARISNAIPFAPHGCGALLPSISMVAWLFLGSESVTVPGEEVVGAGRTIRRAAYLGFTIASALYFLIAVSLMFGLPARAIAGSASPLAVAAENVFGSVGRTLVSLGALVSILGALNGWLLVTGRLPFAAARNGLAPAAFAGVHPRFATPALSLFFSSLVAALFLALSYNRTLLQAYNEVAMISTATALIAIGAACIAYVALLKREPSRFSPHRRSMKILITLIGLTIVCFMIIGTGFRIVIWSLVSMLIPMICYIWLKRHRRIVVGF